MTFSSADLEIFSEELRRLSAPLLSSLPASLRSAIEYSLFSGGKRIRPRILIEAAKLAGLPLELTWAPAIAVEMAHTYTLIHDDLPCMDNDDFRRGVPTNHKIHGEANALLAGDALIGLAQDALLTLRGRVSDGCLLDAVALLSRTMGAAGVIAGQCLEEDLRAKPDPKLLARVHALKTGALFEASLLLPGVLQGWAPARLAAFRSLAIAWGTAFQIADDLEDPEAEAIRDARNIRAYASREEAARIAREGMTEGLRLVERELGREAPGLRAFSAEIERKLEVTA